MSTVRFSVLDRCLNLLRTAPAIAGKRIVRCLRSRRINLVLIGAGLSLALGVLSGCIGTIIGAEQSLRTGDYGEAKRRAETVLKSDSDNKRALMVYGWSQFNLGDYRSALAVFRRAEAVDRDDSVYGPQAGIAWSHLKLGDLDGAKTQFLKAKSKPRHYYETWDIKDGLGWIAYARGDFAQAQKYFKYKPHFLQGAPNDVAGGYDFGSQKDTWVGRGLIALNQNQLAKAGEIFSEGADKDPDYFRHYDGLARTALLAGRFKEALDYALEAADKVAFDEGLAFLINAILQRINSPQRNVQVFTNLLEGSKNGRGYHAFLGRAQLRTGDLKEAEASFVKALEFKSDDDWVKGDLAEVRRRMNKLVASGWVRYFNGRYQEALAIFEAKRRQGRQNGNPTAETGRGWALLSLGRRADALKAFQGALGIDPNYTNAKEGVEAVAKPQETLYAQAWAFAEAGKFDFARRQFLRAKKQAPKDFQWKVEDGLAWVLFYQKETAKAETQFRRILNNFPGAFLSRKGLGFVALDRGDYSGAAEHLFASFSQEPKQILTSYTFSALGFLKAGKFDIAMKILKLGNKVYPGSADILFLLAKTYKELNDPSSAATMAVNSAKRAPVYISPVFDELALEPAAAKDAYLAMAKGLYRAGDNVGAINRISDYFKAGGKDLEALRLRGFALFRQGRYKEANANLTRAAEREPDGLSSISEVVRIPGADRPWKIEYDARSTLAWSYFRLGNAREAARRFQAVVKTKPSWIDSLTGLGYSLLAQGDKEGALRSFRRALIVSPGYPDAWQGMGLVIDAR